MASWYLIVKSQLSRATSQRFYAPCPSFGKTTDRGVKAPFFYWVFAKQGFHETGRTTGFCGGFEGVPLTCANLHRIISPVGAYHTVDLRIRRAECRANPCGPEQVSPGSINTQIAQVLQDCRRGFNQTLVIWPDKGSGYTGTHKLRPRSSGDRAAAS